MSVCVVDLAFWDLARGASGIRPARRAARLFLCRVLCAVCTRPHTRSGFVRSQAKSRETNFPFAQDQSRRPGLSGDSVAPDPGRLRRVVAPGSTRTAGRPWVDPRPVVRSASERGRPAVDRTRGATPGRFSESFCCACRVCDRPEVEIPQLSAVVAPGSTSVVVCRASAKESVWAALPAASPLCTAEPCSQPRADVSQGLTTGFKPPEERPSQPSRPQAPPRPLQL